MLEKDQNESKVSLLAQWKLKKKDKAVLSGISKAPEGAVIPLSKGQRRLWFLQQMYADSSVYNYSESYTFKGDLHLENLCSALKMVCNAHSILRATYHMEDGQLFMKFAEESQIEFSNFDLSNLPTEVALKKANDIMLDKAKYAFNLKVPPQVLATIIKISPSKHILLLTLHHIYTDKWSMGLLREEWASYYRSLNEGSTPRIKQYDIQYGDFTYWQQQQEEDPKQLQYWKEKLSGEIPTLNLPLDFSRPTVTSFHGGASPTQYFSKDLSQQILNVSKALDVTPYVLCLSVYYVQLFRYSGQEDILIGSPVASRDQRAIESLIGFFNDTIVLRTSIIPEMSFATFVKKVKQTTLEAFSNKDIAFDTLVNKLKIERSRDINPFFQTMFLYHAVPKTPIFAEDVVLEHSFFDGGVSKFDLTLYISEEDGILSSTFEYASDLFKAATIERFQEHFKNLLKAVVANQNQQLSKLSFLSKKEQLFMTSNSLNKANAFSSFNAIHEVFVSVAKTKGTKTAIAFKNETMDYKQLNHQSDVLALEILKTTKGKNEIVALCFEKSLDMIVGLLGILKAGCAYLPIDAKYPQDRIDFMLKDAQIQLVLSYAKSTAVLAHKNLTLLVLDEIDYTVTTKEIKLPSVPSNAMAYMIYTSGSSGRPKGVPITHKNILSSTAARLEFYKDAPECFLLLSSISFDSSKAGIFWTLTTGGTLVVAEDQIEQDVTKVEAIIAKHQITHTLMLPSLYDLVLQYCNPKKLQSLNTVIVAGESCATDLCLRHFSTLDSVNMVNEYGPTEATVWCIAHNIKKQDISHKPVAIGKPIASAEIYLLDPYLNLVPIGAAGEIYIGGEGLSGEYFNRPELTAKAYIDNPFDETATTKLYKTGDFARYSDDGTIEFLGRNDQQVKIRGYRIEIDEIERAILEEEAITNCVVLVDIFGAKKSKRLVACFTANSKLNSAELKNRLKLKLPEYMVPSLLQQIEHFPKLPNGKIDKTLLKNLAKKGTELTNEVTKRELTKLESKLVLLWQKVLQIEGIKIDDNFFDLGGDSILSIQFIAEAKKEGLTLSPNQIFDYQTIEKLATFLELKTDKVEDWNYLVAIRKEGFKKPIFCIHAGGGHIFFYNILRKYIPKERPIYALQAAGVYGEKQMPKDIEQMATDYLKAIRSIQPKGPYNIVVYCFSVAVGHYMAHLLSLQNEAANLIVIDTMADPWNLNTPKRLKMRIKGFVKRTMNNPLKAISGMILDRWVYKKANFKAANSPEEQALVNITRNLAAISTAYKWHPIQSKVSIVLTNKLEQSINDEIVNSWQELVKTKVEVVTTAGEHKNIFEEPDVADVASKIENFSI